MISAYPEYDKNLVFSDDKKEMDLVIEYNTKYIKIYRKVEENEKRIEETN